ncbi:MAG: hypothetical protein CL678_05145 [Bdellovibrionaceae bacterium]|nr:hypothetical protein [Pseudobdellovibrionaceae bacterium]
MIPAFLFELVKMKNFLLVLIWNFLICFQIHASDGPGFFIEPYAGLEFGNLSQTNGGTAGNLTSSLSIMGLGLKTGVQIQNYFGAIGIGFSPLGGTLSDQVNASDISAHHLSIGLVGGGTLPWFPLELWLGLYFYDQILVELDNSGNTKYTGLGYQFGVGYLIDMNWGWVEGIKPFFQVTHHSYDNVIQNNESLDLPVNLGGSTTGILSTTNIMVGVSVPITFYRVLH